MPELHYRLRGEIDMSNADEIAHELAASIRHSDAGLVIDCSDLVFIDSSGMTMLLAIQRSLTDDCRTFRVTNAPRALRVLCDVLGVTHVFRLRDGATDGDDVPA
jgi:anti-sigma B factor antagonist